MDLSVKSGKILLEKFADGRASTTGFPPAGHGKKQVTNGVIAVRAWWGFPRRFPSRQRVWLHSARREVCHSPAALL